MTDEYREKLKEGLAFENYITEKMNEIGLAITTYKDFYYQCNIGESVEGYEIKNDRMFRDTGNLYIEVYEKSNKDNLEWIPSGINRKDNTKWWIIGDEISIFIIEKDRLYDICKQCDWPRTESPTSRGYLLKINDIRDQIKELIFNKK